MPKDENNGWMDEFADSLDPLHVNDTFFGNGDGTTSFDEMLIADDADDVLGEDADADESDHFDDTESYLSLQDDVTDSIMINLSFSFPEPKRTAPTEGTWKYYNETWKSWNFAQALIDRFPELAPDYEANSDSTLPNIITETYEIDKPRAVRYLYWLWGNFPRDYFNNEEDGAFKRNSYQCRGELIQQLIINNEHDAFLYDLLKTNVFMQAMFIDGIMEKHNEWVPARYICYLLSFDDYASAEKAYHLFLEGQKGRYGTVDLGKMWDNVVWMGIMYNHRLSDEIKCKLLRHIRPLVDKIGERGKKVIHSIDESIEKIRKRREFCREERTTADDANTKEVYTKNDRLVYLAVSYIEAERQAEMPAYAQIVRRFLIGKKESAFYEFFEKHPDVCAQNRNITFHQVEESLDRLCKEGLLIVKNTGRRGNVYSVAKKPNRPIVKKALDTNKKREQNGETSFVQEIRQRIQANDLFREYSTPGIQGTELMAHQRAGVALAEKYDRFAFFYDTGTGKTIMALSIIAERYRFSGTRFLIVAPKPLIKSAWLSDKEFFPRMRILPLSANVSFAEYKALYNKWANEDGEPPLPELNSGTNEMDEPSLVRALARMTHHVIVNAEQLLPLNRTQEILQTYGIRGMIVDESAIIKNYSTKTAQRIRTIAKQMEYVYILSGKPAPNSPLEYFSQMRIVDPVQFRMSFDSFKDQFFTERGRRELTFKSRKAEREVSRMIGARSIFVKKEECLDLPDEVNVCIPVEMDVRSRTFYAQVMQNIITEIIDMDGKSIHTVRMGRLARITKLREIASGFYLDEKDRFHISPSKLSALMLILDEIGDNQVLIWCNFQFEIEIIEKELKKRGFSVVTGYSKTKRLDENIRLFKSGKVQYMIAHPKTLKYGVTFTSCHYAVYNSLSYSFEDYYQSHDRIYRAGQKNNCFYYHLLSENSIDEIIYKSIGNKHMTSKVFEQLIKSSGKFGLRKEQIERALHVSPEVVTVATSAVNAE